MKKQYGIIKCPRCGEKWKIRSADGGEYFTCHNFIQPNPLIKKYVQCKKFFKAREGK